MKYTVVSRNGNFHASADNWYDAVRRIAELCQCPLEDVRILTRGAYRAAKTWFVYFQESDMLADIKEGQRTRWAAIASTGVQ